MAKRKFGIEVMYAVHGWSHYHAPQDIEWKYTMNFPIYSNAHMAAYRARQIISQIAFPTITEVEGSRKVYDFYHINPFIRSEMSKAGFVENKDWHVLNGEHTGNLEGVIMFRNRKSMLYFYNLVLKIKGYEEKNH